VKMTSESWPNIHRLVERHCLEAGLDLVHASALSHLPMVPVPPQFRSDALALVIANSGAIWPPLRAWLALRSTPVDHPVDSYVMAAVTKADEAMRDACGTESAVRWAHRRYDDGFVPFQRVAHAAGVAHLSPSALCIHPTHGPWLALRALLIVNVAGPREQTAAPDPCNGCAKPCMAPFQRAQERKLPTAQDWLEVRDACPEQRSSRYPEPLLRYHYTKDRSQLG